MYTGGIPTLYTSANKGDLWTALGTPPGTGTIKTIAVAPSNTSIIYTVKENAVSRSTNSGTSFTNVTGTLPVANAALSGVTVSNTDPNKVWVTFSGYSAGEKVFKSTNGGTTWTNVSTGLPNLPINTIVYTKGSTNDAIYVGGDIGVYYLDNMLSSFASYFTSLPNVGVRDLEIFYPTGKLRAGTYGRGVWESDLYVAIILPLDLISFNAQLQAKKDALLTWTTTKETNLKGYEIEMANGSMAYKNIGFVAGKGTAAQTVDYRFVVPDLLPGTYSFRLKMVDKDGKFSYSPVRIIKVGDGEVVVYPMPFHDRLTVALPPIVQEAVLQLVNKLGQVVILKTITAGQSIIDTKKLSSGIYFIKIWEDKKLISVQKVIKE